MTHHKSCIVPDNFGKGGAGSGGAQGDRSLPLPLTGAASEPAMLYVGSSNRESLGASKLAQSEATFRIDAALSPVSQRLGLCRPETRSFAEQRLHMLLMCSLWPYISVWVIC